MSFAPSPIHHHFLGWDGINHQFHGWFMTLPYPQLGVCNSLPATLCHFQASAAVKRKPLGFASGCQVVGLKVTDPTGAEICRDGCHMLI